MSKQMNKIAQTIEAKMMLGENPPLVSDILGSALAEDGEVVSSDGYAKQKDTTLELIKKQFANFEKLVKQF